MNRPVSFNMSGLSLPAILLLAFTVLLSSAFEASAGQFLVKVRQAACVQGERVLLGEIADPLPALPRENWERMAAAVLWDSPPKGRGPVVIPQVRLSILFKEHLGPVAGAVLLPDALQVQRGGAVLMSEGLERKVVEFLTPSSRGLGGEVSFRDFRLPSTIFLQDGSGTLEIHLSRGLQPGRNGLRFVVKNAYNQRERSLSGSVFVDVWAIVACAARPLNRREAVGPGEVTFMRKNLAYLRGPVWDGRGLSMRMTAPVGEGQVLYADTLEPMPLIQKGDRITLVFQGSSIQLHAPAQALTDGGVGERIAVMNMETKRTVQARIIDAQTAVVR
jgi:flagellar basal body P-ring formation protein FlgA